MISRLSVLVVCAAGLAQVCAAQIAFTTFVPDDTFPTSIPYTVQAHDRALMNFTSLLSGRVENVRLATALVSGDPTVHIALHAVTGENDFVGAQLAMFTFSDSNSSPHIAVASNTDPDMVLSAGTQYWLAYWSESDGVHRWFRGNTVNGRISRTLDDGQTYSYGSGFRLAAFEVNVVPEPGTILVLCIGAAAVLRNRRRLRND